MTILVNEILYSWVSCRIRSFMTKSFTTIGSHVFLYCRISRSNKSENRYLLSGGHTTQGGKQNKNKIKIEQFSKSYDCSYYILSKVRSKDTSRGHLCECISVISAILLNILFSWASNLFVLSQKPDFLLKIFVILFVLYLYLFSPLFQFYICIGLFT